ncbi:hypothetical protein F5H01DRAFT_338605 [Linnemannia elongata]|nr:hypothetical protein F5H01DRAFT_338605 [Linnemannia elongata]
MSYFCSCLPLFVSPYDLYDSIPLGLLHMPFFIMLIYAAELALTEMNTRLLIVALLSSPLWMAFSLWSCS